MTKAPLTITANNKSMVYDNTVPAFDAGYSGFVNGDTSGVVSGLTCGATKGQGHPVSSTTPPAPTPSRAAELPRQTTPSAMSPGTLTIKLFTAGNLLALSQDGATCPSAAQQRGYRLRRGHRRRQRHQHQRPLPEQRHTQRQQRQRAGRRAQQQ